MSLMRVVLAEVVEPAISAVVVAKEDRQEKRVVVVAPRRATLEVWSRVARVEQSRTLKGLQEAHQEPVAPRLIRPMPIGVPPPTGRGEQVARDRAQQAA
jgi:hypothetical protein